LFEQVLGEARTINEVLDAEQQERQTSAANRLAVVGTIGVVFAIGIGALQVVDSAYRSPGVLLLALVICLITINFLIRISVPVGEVFDRWSTGGSPEARRFIRNLGECFSDRPRPVREDPKP
jgi:hypothetical protein